MMSLEDFIVQLYPNVTQLPPFVKATKNKQLVRAVGANVAELRTKLCRSQLSRAKLITRFDDRYAVAKYSKSKVWSKIPEGSTLIFKGT